MNIGRLIVCWTGLIGLLCATGSGADETEAMAHHKVVAKPIVRSAPRYPGSELNQSSQGWVQLSYVVTKEGRVTDPVIEDSSGSKAFERQALRAVEDWRYEPATLDGEPIEQCATEVRLIFALDGAGTGVTRSYYKRHKRIARLLDNGELQKAEKAISQIRQSQNVSISEDAWLWSLQARLYGLQGDKKRQLTAVRRATRSEKWVDKSLYPNLLLVRTALELEDGDLSTALETHEKLEEVGSDHPNFAILKAHIDGVREKIAGDAILRAKARIGENGHWQYRPLRRTVSIADLKGTLGNIEFRCPWQHFVEPAVSAKTWTMPDEWGECSVFVFGDQGATFSLLELPTET